MTAAEKRKLAADRKRENAPTQYTPFVSKRKFMSRFGEYQFAEWRFKRTELYITMDTIIPSMPKKLLEELDDGKYHL